ncbi:hypothetical protein [Colwellia sp. TT2012]|uniref:hypothetical protein n=1 Tax=Colwellia sp. TT2012 TaxID=1720342 RepID=UPI0007102CB2|nr:hypothetical protein [Colwellia sp. TT2012]
MSPNELINLFTKHNLIPNDPEEQEEALDLIDEDEDSELNALELLAEFAADNSIDLSLGDCVPKDVIGEFMANFEQVAEVSKGKVKAQNLKVTPEVGTTVNETKDIEITFDWNSKNYSFSFSKVEPDGFIDEFSKWVFEAFDGNFLFIKDDLSFGYVIPKTLIKELESIGLENAVS